MGDHNGGVADAHHQMVAEEEVHGQVHLGTQPDQQGDEQAGLADR